MIERFLFTGPNCPACHQLKNRIKAIGLTDKLTEVDTSTKEGLAKAKEHEIRGLPTILVVSDGKVEDILRGALHSDAALKGFINNK